MSTRRCRLALTARSSAPISTENQVDSPTLVLHLACQVPGRAHHQALPRRWPDAGKVINANALLFRDARPGGPVPGCDSPEHPVAVIAVSPPHHGTMIPLPEDRGLVELVNEPEVSDRRKPEPTAIVAYFLQIDGKSPLVPAPDDVNFAIQSAGAGGGRSKQDSGDRIRLTAQPKPDDPLGAGRFASKTGPYALDRTARHPDSQDRRPGDIEHVWGKSLRRRAYVSETVRALRPGPSVVQFCDAILSL